MKILKILGFVFVGLIAIFVVGGLLLPNEWEVSRSISIAAPAEAIYVRIADLKRWEEWSPWTKAMDPTMNYTYEGAEVGAGAKRSWTSSNMGTGWMQITEASQEMGIQYDLFIDMGKQSLMHGQMAFEHQGDSIMVTWSDRGDSGNNWLYKWMSLICINTMLGKQLDQGLAQLKEQSESSTASESMPVETFEEMPPNETPGEMPTETPVEMPAETPPQ